MHWILRTVWGTVHSFNQGPAQVSSGRKVKEGKRERRKESGRGREGGRGGERSTNRCETAGDKSTEVSSIKFSFLFLIPLVQSISRGLKINLKSKTQHSSHRKIERKGGKTLKNNLPDLMRESPTPSSPSMVIEQIY